MVDRENLERTTLTPEELQVYNPVQKWCADMWAVLWGAWKLGAQTVIEPGLSFSWGSSNLAEYLNNNIMHNAGITSNQEGKVFYKGEFINRNPFEFDLILIDIHNTWESIYDVVIKNDIINNTIKKGSIVIIEGGADAHPRINKDTLALFHKNMGRTIFDFNHISGARTSLSILKLLI